MGFFEPALEKMRPTKIRTLQLQRLKKMVRYTASRVPYYRRKLKQTKASPDSIRTLEDVAKLPFMAKDDLRETYPYGLLAVPLSEIEEFHASSGTTGKPTVVGYNRHDKETWTRLMARCYAASGAKEGDVVQNAYGYGLFTGGLGFHYGAQALGLAVWPMSSGNTKRQLLFMKDMGSTILASTPSYALYVGEEARKEGYDPPKDFKLRLGMFGAEPWSEEAREKIEMSLGLRANDCYGLSELYGPGVAMECEEQNGLHIWSDEFLPETIDPETGEVLGPGERGELVFTMLTREAMPLIRFRTRDLARIDAEECECGRYHPRIMRVTGRSDDMLIIGGVNVFPSQVEDVLMRIPGVGEWYEIVVDRDVLDRLHVRVEVEPTFYESPEFDPNVLQQTITDELRSVLTVFARVELLKPGMITRTEGKARRVIDLRKQM